MEASNAGAVVNSVVPTSLPVPPSHSSPSPSPSGGSKNSNSTSKLKSKGKSKSKSTLIVENANASKSNSSSPARTLSVVSDDWDPYLFGGYEDEGDSSGSVDPRISWQNSSASSASSTSSPRTDEISAAYLANILLPPVTPLLEDKLVSLSAPYYLDDDDSYAENVPASSPRRPLPTSTTLPSSPSYAKEAPSPRASAPESPTQISSDGLTKISGKNHVDWNKAFQKILLLSDSFKKYQQLSSLYRDFCYAAKTYGRIIISEKFLPIDEKTIRPVDAGGIAGGIKYLVSGILFKFAVDTYNERSKTWLYGFDTRDDAAAAKAAGHELKGLIHMFNTRHVASLLHYPLFALIDYRGFRLIATAFLPIDKTTIKYGSHDAGNTVHADIPELNSQMRSAATFLNLEPHHVGTQEEPMYFCGDIEGHLGTDGKYYCLDFARVFPPERLPKEEIRPEDFRKKHFLFKLLRPELVKSNQVPLNSDALSRFILGEWYPEEKRDAARGVMKATQRLLTQVIPSFLATISKIPPVELQEKAYSLTDEIHRFGINCRHLGRIRSDLIASGGPFRQKFIMNEIVARSCKNLLRLIWRKKLEELQMPSSEPYLDVALDFFNRLLHNQRNIWFDPGLIKAGIAKSFKFGLTEEETNPDYDLRKSIDFAPMMERLEKLSKVKLEARFHQILKSTTIIGALKLLKVDIKNVSCGLKQLPLMSLSEGKMLLMQAREETDGIGQSQRIYQMANERFAFGLASNVNDADILFAWGESLLGESKVSDPKTALSKLKEALFKFTRASELSHLESKLQRVFVLTTMASLSLDPFQTFENLRLASESVSSIKSDELVVTKADDLFQSLHIIHSQTSLARSFVDSIDADFSNLSYVDDTIISRFDGAILDHSVAYHFHLFALERCYSVRLYTQAAIILRSWGSLLSSAGKDGSSLVIRASQSLQAVLRTSKIVIPLISKDQRKILSGPAVISSKKSQRDSVVLGSPNSIATSRAQGTVVFDSPIYTLRKKKAVIKGWRKKWCCVQGPYLIFKESEDGEFVPPGFELTGAKLEHLRVLTSNCIRVTNVLGEEVTVSFDSQEELTHWEETVSHLMKQRSAMTEKFLAEFYNTTLRDENWQKAQPNMVVYPKQGLLQPILVFASEKAVPIISRIESLSLHSSPPVPFQIVSPLTLLFRFDLGKVRLKEINFRCTLGSIEVTAASLPIPPSLSILNHLAENLDLTQTTLDDLVGPMSRSHPCLFVPSAVIDSDSDQTYFAEIEGNYVLLSTFNYLKQQPYH